MPTPPLPPSEGRPVDNLAKGSDEAIQAYLGVVDDGEIARLAAMMTPKNKVFNPGALVAQATALKAEVTTELVRRREAIANSMSYATLLELAGILGVGDVGFLHVVDEDTLTDPITGPVLRRLVEMMRAMPSPQDFQDQFFPEDPTAALALAASRTNLRRPLPGASFEEELRYAANIPTDEVSGDILKEAFLDFLRIWCLYPTLPEELFPVKSGTQLTEAEVSELLANLNRHQQELASFHDSFTPGQDFPPGIDEVAHRAYAECWEGGLQGPSWWRRRAWLVVEFHPFWQRHGEAYRSIHNALAKTAESAKKEKSAINQKAGETGLKSREAQRWKSVTTDFIQFLKKHSENSDPKDMKERAANFVKSNPLLGGDQNKAKSLEFLQTLCVAVMSGTDERTVLETLKRSKLTKILAREPQEQRNYFNNLTPTQREDYRLKSTIPSTWVQYKSLTEEAVRDCLDDLKAAWAEIGTKKVEKKS